MSSILFHTLKLTQGSKSSPWSYWKKVKIQSVLANKQEKRWLLTWPFYTTMIVELKKNRLGKNMVIEYKCINPSGHLEKIFYKARIWSTKAIVALMQHIKVN